MKKQTHIEISSGGTKIVSFKNCPLSKPIKKEQICHDTCCCMIEAMTEEDFVCPHFSWVINHNSIITIVCDKLKS